MNAASWPWSKGWRSRPPRWWPVSRPDVLYERLSLFGTAGSAGWPQAVGAIHVVEVNALLAAGGGERGVGFAWALEANARERQVLAEADLRVAVSDELAAQVAAMSCGPTVTVANGVDTVRFGLVHDRLASRRCPRACRPRPTWSGLPARCGLGTGLIRAVRALALTRGSPLLAVAGDGEVRSELELLRQSWAWRTASAGSASWPTSTSPSFWRHATCSPRPYPQTADFAFSPLKLLEYLASGVPGRRLRHRPDQHPAWPAVEFGTLVPAGDVAALAAAFDQTLGFPTDTVGPRRCGTAPHPADAWLDVPSPRTRCSH